MDPITIAAFAGGVLSIGAGLFGANAEGKEMVAQAEYSKRMTAINSAFADNQAKMITRIGATEANRIRQQGRQLVGQQKAGYAGQGVDVMSGSATSVYADALEAAATDAATVENNAWLEAWGVKSEAKNAKMAAQVNLESARMGRGTTMLTGGMQALGQGLGLARREGLFAGGKT